MKNSRTKKLTTVGMLCALACNAAFFYKRHRTKSGAVKALACGWTCQIAVITFLIYKPVVTTLRKLQLVFDTDVTK